MADIRNELSGIWKRTRIVSDWDSSRFSWGKASVCAQLSRIAYFPIPEFEFEERGRFKLIPCDLHYELIERKEFLTTERLRQADFGPTFIIHGHYSVIVGVMIDSILFIAIRGTSALYKSSLFYDIGTDLNFIPITVNKYSREAKVKLHRGFFRAAAENIHSLRQEIRKITTKYQDKIYIYITGHSLGGAMAAILYELLSGHRSNDFECAVCKYGNNSNKQLCDSYLNNYVYSAYCFGAPRYGNIWAISSFNRPYNIQHRRDPVPKLPPKILGYSDGRCNKVIDERPCKECGSRHHSGKLKNVILPYCVASHRVEGYCKSVDLMALEQTPYKI